MQLEGAQHRLDGCATIEQTECLVQETEDLVARLASDRHPVGHVEHVAAGGEPVDVFREGSERLQVLAAEQEDQIRVWALPEDGPDVDEGLQRAAEATPGVLG